MARNGDERSEWNYMDANGMLWENRTASARGGTAEPRTVTSTRNGVDVTRTGARDSVTVLVSGGRRLAWDHYRPTRR